MKLPRWTPAEDGAMRRMWSEGRPIDEIAAAVGRTYHAVVERRKRLGLPGRPGGGRPRDGARDDELRRLWSEGATTIEAAAALGMSKTGVDGWRRALGLPARQKGNRTVPEERDDELRRLWSEGRTSAEIGRALGLSADGVRSRRVLLGLPARPRGRPGPRDRVRDDELRRLWSEGATTIEAAAALGVSRSAVDGRRRALGLPARRRTGRPRAAAPAAPGAAPPPAPVGEPAAFAPRWPSGLTIRDVPGPPPATCQWIDGDPRRRGFCGAPVAGRDRPAPYCEEHLARAYRRGTA